MRDWETMEWGEGRFRFDVDQLFDFQIQTPLSLKPALAEHAYCSLLACGCCGGGNADGLSGWQGVLQPFAPTLSLGSPDAAAQLNRGGFDWGTAVGGVITFGFAVSTNNYDQTGSGYDINASELTEFSAFTSAQRTAARDAIEFWDDILSVSFVEQTLTSSTSATNAPQILFGNSQGDDAPAQASAYFPFSSPIGGDVWINDTQASNFDFSFGGYGTTTLIHEIGHAIGLEHPGDYNFGDGGPITYNDDAGYIEDSLQYSIMSYFDGIEVGTFDHVAPSVGYQYPMSPLLHDIAAAQAIYGADYTTRSGDTTYGFNASGLSGSSHDNAFDFDLNPNPVIAVWDGGGIDTFDFSEYVTDVVIDLFDDNGAGAFSSTPLMTNNVAIAHGVVIENAIGGSGNDVITGNDAANTLTGGIGADEINGGYGSDTLLGGSGVDLLRENPGASAFDVRSVAPIVHTSGGGSIGAAVSLNGHFDADRDIDAPSGGQAYATIDAVGDGGRDYFAITITDEMLQSGSVFIQADLDRGWRSTGTSDSTDFDGWLSIVGPNGSTILRTDDDSSFANDAGSTGGGFTASRDSFLTFSATTAGTYYIVVGSWQSGLNEGDLNLGGVVPTGADYRLHVTLNVNDVLQYDTRSTLGDVFDGGAGDDTMIGGVGDDLFIHQTQNGFDTISGSRGLDIIDMSGSSNGINVNFDRAGADVWSLGVATTDSATTNNVEGVIATNFNDVVRGGRADNFIGLHSDGVGGGGFDDISGGIGNDTASFATFATAVVVDLERAGVQARTRDTDNYSSGTFRDIATFVSIENLVGSAFSDRLHGNKGDNVFGYVRSDSGDGGFDRYIGRAGNDWADFSAFDAAILVDMLELSQEVRTRDSTNLNSGTFRNIADFASIENVIGTAFDDQFFGSNGSNIYGYVDGPLGDGGFDRIDGRGAFDVVDFSRFSSAVLVDLELGSSGQAWTQDTTDMTSGVSRQIAVLISIEGVVGSIWADEVYGDDANNIFYYVDDFGLRTQVSNGGAGSALGVDLFDGRGGDGDRIDFSLFDSAIRIDLARSGAEVRTTDTSDIASGTLRDIVDLVSVERATGSRFDDILNGDSANNVFDGGDGDDRIRGNGGADRLTGGLGDDLFLFNKGNGADTITDFVAGGSEDGIRLFDFGTQFDTFAEILAASSQIGADVTINLGGGDSIRLLGVDLDDLTAGDFGI